MNSGDLVFEGSSIGSKKQELTHINDAIHPSLFENNQFINQRWRSFLRQIACKIDKQKIGIEVISPFGFEVMEDKKFLKTTLKRFYCYIGIPNKYHLSKTLYRQAFEDELFRRLSEHHPSFYGQVILKVSERDFIKLRDDGYICSQTDKLIDIQCRSVQKNILDDYADYVICSLSAIHHRKDEPKKFLNNARFRNRTYQLYVMLEKIFGKYAGTLTERETTLAKMAFKKINNNIDIFYNNQILCSTADESDCIILNELIMPRVNMMINKLYNLGELIDIHSHSFHVEDDLNITINRRAYFQAKQFIKSSYLNYV